MNNKKQFSKVTLGVALLAGAVAVGGVGVAVTKTLKHQSHSNIQSSKPAAPIVAQNAPIFRTGQAGGWSYRCVYAPDTLAAGPSLCAMEQVIYVRVPQSKSPVRFGSLFVSHATQDPTKVSLQNVPWFLSVVVPAGVDTKDQPQLVLSKNSHISMAWKNCGPNACSAEVALKNEQLRDLLATTKTSLQYTRKGAGPFTLNLDIPGSNVAMNTLLQWTAKAPFNN